MASRVPLTVSSRVSRLGVRLPPVQDHRRLAVLEGTFQFDIGVLGLHRS